MTVRIKSQTGVISNCSKESSSRIFNRRAVFGQKVGRGFIGSVGMMILTLNSDDDNDPD